MHFLKWILRLHQRRAPYAARSAFHSYTHAAQGTRAHLGGGQAEAGGGGQRLRVCARLQQIVLRQREQMLRRYTCIRECNQSNPMIKYMI